MLPASLSTRPSLAARDHAIRASEGGLDALESRVVVVNGSMSVVYANAAATQMFSRAEETIRRGDPTFRASSLAGRNLRDVAPELARLLTAGDLATGVARMVQVWGHAFRVSATRIDDEEGRMMGMALEWEDVAEEVALDGLLAAALSGPAASTRGWTRSPDRLGLRAAMRELVSQSRAGACEVLQLLTGPARRRAARAAMN